VEIHKEENEGLLETLTIGIVKRNGSIISEAGQAQFVKHLSYAICEH
jgi:hypothetical protein